MRLLIERGASLSAKDEAGAIPLHVAVIAGLPQTVLLLLKHGASLTVRRHNMGMKQECSLQTGFVHQDVDEDGRASLHKAAYAGHAEVCQLLLDHGADVNAKYGTIFTHHMKERTTSRPDQPFSFAGTAAEHVRCTSRLTRNRLAAPRSSSRQEQRSTLQIRPESLRSIKRASRAIAPSWIFSLHQKPMSM